MAKPEGDAVANEVVLRGFDAKHGQDIAFSPGPGPLTSPRTYTARAKLKGDFAVAGSINFDLGVLERGVTAKLSRGSFDTWRLVEG